MKKKVFGIFICLLFSQAVHGATDVVLETVSGSCAMHYLTDRNITGWKIAGENLNCQDGLLHGGNTVLVVNAFGEPIEQLQETFSYGYRTEDTLLVSKILSNTADENGNWKITFLNKEEPEYSAKFIAQMTAFPKEDGFFTPFKGCPEFKVLVVVPTMDILDTDRYFRPVIESAKKQALLFCGADNAKKVQLFASTQENPTQEDIFLFVDINLTLNTEEVKRIPLPNQQFQAGTNILTPYSVPKKKESLINPIFQQDIKLPETENETTIITEITEDTEKNPKDAIDIPQHLFLTSKVLARPIIGKTIVFVYDISADGKALINYPVLAEMTGIPVGKGWGIVSGDFSAQKRTKNNKNLPRISAKKWTSCQQYLCKDKGYKQ